MISFFKKIREKLLSEGKTGKYVKYAIGEIVLVVIGILIALQINNWNEHRLTNEAVKTYLDNLKQELKNDQEILSNSIEWHSFKFHSMKYLLEMEGSNLYDPVADEKTGIPHFPAGQNNAWRFEVPEVYDKEFIVHTISYMHRAVMYPFPKSTVEELKSTGMFSEIPQELKWELTRYYIFKENDFNGKVQSLAMDFQASLAEDGFITTDIYKLEDPISLIKDNPKRIGLIKRMIRESGWTVISSQRAIENNIKLITLIEQEIVD